MGVAFLPIHRYYNPGHRNHNKWCIVLGRERAGSYAGAYNFIGGAGSAGESERTSLFREVEKELGLVLNENLLRICLIERVRVKGTSFFGSYITGISSRKWHAMMHACKHKHLAWEFQEMDDIQSFPICELSFNSQISSYVRQFIPLIQRLNQQVSSVQSVHYSQFVQLAPRRSIPMLQ